MSTTALKMFHAVDPAEKIKQAIGDLSDIRLINNEVLVGVYLRPDTIELGGGKKLFVSDGFRDEDRFQGKVGLVLKKGPMAFVDDATTDFEGQDVEIGEWVVFQSADGWSVTMRGVLCRMVKDTSLRMVIPSPDFVY